MNKSKSKKLKIHCQFCGSTNVRFMTNMQISAPAELMHRLSKEAFRRHDVTIWGVSWEATDFICGNCRRVTAGYGNYVTNLEKKNKELESQISELEQKILNLTGGHENGCRANDDRTKVHHHAQDGPNPPHC